MRVKLFSSALPLGLFLWTGAVSSLPALTVSDLLKQMANGDNLTVIDVRLPAFYARGHIPGAINIPASLCAIKNLPPLGTVVVCGEGFGRDDNAAAVALGAKPGIKPDVLQGGFVAWESARAQTTHRKGIEPEAPHYLSYADLKAMQPADAVLVDLRESSKATNAARRSAITEAANASLTDLAAEFPGMAISHSPFSVSPESAKIPGSTPPLMVLVDRGDGAARDMARALEANGIKRYTILAGGELALERHGKPGRQRGSASRKPVVASVLPITH